VELFPEKVSKRPKESTPKEGGSVAGRKEGGADRGEVQGSGITQKWWNRDGTVELSNQKTRKGWRELIPAGKGGGMPTISARRRWERPGMFERRKKKTNTKGKEITVSAGRKKELQAPKKTATDVVCVNCLLCACQVNAWKQRQKRSKLPQHYPEMNDTGANNTRCKGGQGNSH